MERTMHMTRLAGLGEPPNDDLPPLEPMGPKWLTPVLLASLVGLMGLLFYPVYLQSQGRL